MIFPLAQPTTTSYQFKHYFEGTLVTNNPFTDQILDILSTKNNTIVNRLHILKNWEKSHYSLLYFIITLFAMIKWCHITRQYTWFLQKTSTTKFTNNKPSVQTYSKTGRQNNTKHIKTILTYIYIDVSVFYKLSNSIENNSYCQFIRLNSSTCRNSNTRSLRKIDWFWRKVLILLQTFF